MRASIVVLLLSCLAGSWTAGADEAAPAAPAAAPAAEQQEPEQFIEVPPPPPADESTASSSEEKDDEDAASDSRRGPEPDVTIINRKDAKYEEYRLNGRLYMVKVTPFIGPPYYFVDRDGDGLMETRMPGRGSQVQVPGWVILSW